MTIIIFDVETTGLPNAEGAPLDSQPRIIEFAGIKLDDELNELERMEFICNPMCQLSDIITKITGLRQTDVEDKLPFSNYYEQLCKFFLGCSKLVAHNATFDVSMLRFELLRMGKLCAFPWPYNHICTIEKTMHYHGYRLNLGKLHKKLINEEHVNGAHRAMPDVEALVRCFKALRKESLV